MAHTMWPAYTVEGRYLRERFPRIGGLRAGPPNRGPWRDLTGATGVKVSSTPSPIPLPYERPVVVPDIRGARSATLGGAFDIRLAARYAPAGWSPNGPEDGRRTALQVQGHDPDKDTAWEHLLDQFRSLPKRGLAQAFDAADPSEELLLRLCVVLAWYQQISVSQGRALMGSIVAEVGPNVSPAYLAGLVYPDMIQAVGQLMTLAEQKLPRPDQCRRVVIEPRCNRGRADLWLDGFLLEIKTSQHAAVTIEYGHQLLAYLLGLQPDLHVHKIGWYFARHGIVWDFTVEDFLEVAAGEPVALDVVRSEWLAISTSRQLL